jgi:Spy/CpxP family protein refolding chaperone
MRLSRLIPAGLLLASLAVPAIAQDAPRGRVGARSRFPLCLLVLDLTPEQKTEIHSILLASWPEFREGFAAVHAAGETLRAALAAEPADACTVGEAALGVQAALQALRDEKEALKNRIAAVLTPEQIARFEGCLDAPFGDLGNLGDLGNFGDFGNLGNFGDFGGFGLESYGDRAIVR